MSDEKQDQTEKPGLPCRERRDGEAFKVGDLVRMKNPWGPIMTVMAVDISPRIAHLTWFGADSALHRDMLPFELLELVHGENQAPITPIPIELLAIKLYEHDHQVWPVPQGRSVSWLKLDDEDRELYRAMALVPPP